MPVWTFGQEGLVPASACFVRIHLLSESGFFRFTGRKAAISKLSRSHVEFSLEHPVEIGEIFKAGFYRNGQYVVLGRKQQTGSHGEPVGVQISGKGSTEGLFEKFHEMGLT